MRVLPAIVIAFLAMQFASAYMPPDIGPLGPDIGGISPHLPPGFFLQKQWVVDEQEDFESGTLSNVTATDDGEVRLDTPATFSLGPAVTLRATLAQSSPSVMSNSYNRFMIAYYESGNVKAKIFDYNGTLQGTYTIAAGSQPYVARFGTSFVVAYRSSTGHDIKYRIVSPEGALGTERTIATGISPANPAIAVSGNGMMAAAWEWSSASAAIRFFNVSTGAAKTPEYARSNSRRFDVIESYPYFVIAYERYTTVFSNWDIVTEVYTTTGPSIVSSKLIGSGAYDDGYPGVRGVSGGYRLVWCVTSGPTRSVKTARFAFSGTQLTLETILASSTSRYYYHTTLAYLSTGRAFVAWADANGPTMTDSRIYGRMINATTNMPLTATLLIESGRSMWPDATAIGNFFIAYDDSAISGVRYREYGAIPYSAGLAVSKTFDAGSVVSFDSIQSFSDGDVKIAYWVGNSTSGTRTFNTAVNRDSGTSIHKAGRYFQWKAYLKRASDPILDGVTVNYSDIAPTSLTISADPAVILADGSARTHLTVYVKDQYGNPMPGINVSFSKSAGTLGASKNTTDAEGKALNYLVAPSSPATVTIGASAGSASNSTVVAAANAFGGVFIIADPALLPADGSGTSTITAIVQKTDGDPFPGQSVTFETTLGTLSASTNTTNGEGEATTTLTSGITAGVALVTASSGGNSATLNITLSPVPANLTLTIDPAPIDADGTSKSNLTALVVDYEGNPYQGAVVSFTTGLGTLSAENATTGADGKAAVQITAPAEPGSATITATMDALTQSGGLDFLLPAEPTPTPETSPEATPPPEITPAPPEETPPMPPSETPTPEITPIAGETATPLECRMSLCDCRCHAAGQTPEELTGRICGINCATEFNATGCRAEGDQCVTEYAPSTVTECHMSMCDCSCYPAGMTPEERDGRLCGINCLGLFNISGCRLADNACVVEYVQASPTPVATATPLPTATPAPGQDSTFWFIAAIVIAVLLLGIIIVGALVLLGGVGGIAYFLGKWTRGKPKELPKKPAKKEE